MQASQVETGMIVAVNEVADGQLYIVREKDGQAVKLTYCVEDGSEVSGGIIHVSALRKPSAAQLMNALKTAWKV